MKRLIAFLILFNSIVVILILGLFFLAESHPLRPGDSFYGVQHLAQQWRLRTTLGTADRAELAIHLADERLADLAQADGRTDIRIAIQAFDAALNEAILAIDRAPDNMQAALYGRLAQLLNQTTLVTASLEKSAYSDLVEGLTQKIAALQAADTRAEIVAVVPQEDELSLIHI